MQQSEAARRYVLEGVMAGDLQASQAAELLGISERHAWRLLAAYRARGAASLEHGNRGRRPHNAVPADVASAVVRFASTRYPGANHTHLAELLWEHEGLDVSSWTVRRILARAGIASPRRRRPPEHRVRRERMPREGMLLQIDGSHHAWLEARGPRFALLLAVDDATGAAVHALFRPVEDARGYFLLLEEIVRRCGIPLALYSDRHGVFKASSDGRRGLKVATQFARAMRELGITQIFARSPQAKGRVERAAGTFQDRLVTELSDASASTIAEAQTVLERFLLRFNARFRVPAAEPEVAYRPLDRALPLASILSFRHLRSVARDNTVKYRWRTLQLLPGPEIEGAVLLSVCAVPPLPFFTVKAEFAGAAVVFRSSLNVTVSVVPFTDASMNVGFVVSTLWPGSAVCAAWSRSASTCSATSVCVNLIVPPLRLSALAAQEMPSWSSSSVATTVWENTISCEPEPLAYATWRVAPPRSNANCGAPVTVTLPVNVTVNSIVSVAP